MSQNIPDVQPIPGIQAHSGASPAMPLYSKISNLCSQIDASGSGSITQSQFQYAFATKSPPARFQAAGADAIWSQLDKAGTGSVSRQDFVQGIAKMSAALKNDGSGLANVDSASKTVANSLSTLMNSGNIDLSA